MYCSKCLKKDNITKCEFCNVKLCDNCKRKYRHNYSLICRKCRYIVCASKVELGEKICSNCYY